MMREIKFRAYDKILKKMFTDFAILPQGIYCDSNQPLLIRLDTPCDGLGQYAIIDAKIPEQIVLEQYTGLKDSKGKEIYEGDIVKVNHLDGLFVALIKHEPACFTFEPIKPNDELSTYYLRPDTVELFKLKVIGNIHENANLLEKG